MIELRLMKTSDISVIQNWPPYPPEFEDLDYALRSNGWLTEYQNKHDTWIYAAELDGEMVAFSLLFKTSEASAEFRIALRADKIGQGLGSSITSMTLAKGFSEIGLGRIHLIVRLSNPRAIRLYERLGFTVREKCSREINGKQVCFLTMSISQASYKDFYN